MRFLSVFLTFLLIACLLFVACTDEEQDPKPESGNLPTYANNSELWPADETVQSNTQAMDTRVADTASPDPIPVASDLPTEPSSEEDEGGIPTDAPVTETVSGQVIIGG